MGAGLGRDGGDSSTPTFDFVFARPLYILPSVMNCMSSGKSAVVLDQSVRLSARLWQTHRNEFMMPPSQRLVCRFCLELKLNQKRVLVMALPKSVL